MQVSQGFAVFRLAPSRIPPRHSQTRRDTNFAIPGYSISAIISRQRRKSKIFLSVVIPVVKAAFMAFSATVGNPANAGVARLCGVPPCPVPDTATALPKQARYQLRYTRLFRYFIRLVVFSQTTRATNCATPGYSVYLSGWSYSPKPPARQRETRLPRREEAASHDNSPTTAPILYITRLPHASIS